MSLGKILVEEGENIVAVVSRSRASAHKGGRFLRCRNCGTDVAAIPPETDLIYLTVPHGAVEEVARSISCLETLRFRRLAVCHASGMLTAEALAPLAMRGATVFSFHPLQTFPRDFQPKDIVESARGIYYGVDGTRQGVRMARLLARKLGGRVVEIPPNMRVFYHAACVLASNHITAMMAILDEMYRQLQPGKTDFFRVFKPIITATLRNIERTSPGKALSGPVARGGVETVASHFEALKSNAPWIIPYFIRLSGETVRLAAAKGSLSPDKAEAFARLFESFQRSQVTT